MHRFLHQLIRIETGGAAVVGVRTCEAAQANYDAALLFAGKKLLINLPEFPG